LEADPARGRAATGARPTDGVSGERTARQKREEAVPRAHEGRCQNSAPGGQSRRPAGPGHGSVGRAAGKRAARSGGTKLARAVREPATGPANVGESPAALTKHLPANEKPESKRTGRRAPVGSRAPVTRGGKRTMPPSQQVGGAGSSGEECVGPHAGRGAKCAMAAAPKPAGLKGREARENAGRRGRKGRARRPWGRHPLAHGHEQRSGWSQPTPRKTR